MHKKTLDFCYVMLEIIGAWLFHINYIILFSGVVRMVVLVTVMVVLVVEAVILEQAVEEVESALIMQVQNRDWCIWSLINPTI